MNDEDIVLSSKGIATRLERIIATLKPYERVEIKLQDNTVGKISIVVTSNFKEVFTLDDGDGKI